MGTEAELAEPTFGSEAELAEPTVGTEAEPSIGTDGSRECAEQVIGALV